MFVELIAKEALRIAIAAGTKIKELRDSNQYDESLKDGYELVTSADIASNNLIKDEISKLFPTHHLLSEEEEPKHYDIQDPTWIVDPIDGTVGYANGHYQVAVSIAFAVDGRVIAGVVYNPFLYEMFHAIEGQGAFLNGKPIRVKDVQQLKQCVIGTGFPHKRDDITDIMMRLQNILPRIRDIRRLGSPALDICWVACGRMQGFYEEKLSPWDVAAAKLIAKEAGARTGYYSDDQSDRLPDCIKGNKVIIASPGVFTELSEILKQQ